MTNKTLARLGLTLLATAIIGCQGNEPPPFNPASIRQTQRLSASGTPRAIYRPPPTTLESEFRVDGDKGPPARPQWVPTTQSFVEPQRRISLQEVIHRTVANNYEVRVAGYDAAIAETQVLENEAKFDPTIFSNLQFQKDYNTNFGSTSLTELGPHRSLTYSAEAGLKQDFASGAHVEFKYNTTRQDVRPPFFPINPFWQNTVSLQLTQPLLQNFGTETTRARITVSRNDRKISLLDFRDKVEKNVADVEKAYWQLYQAMQEVGIQQDLLEATRATGARVRDRFGADVSNIELSNANAQVLQRETTLVDAYRSVRDLSAQVKGLMNDPEFPAASPTLLVPADVPVEVPVTYQLGDQVQTGLENRLELTQQLFRIESAQVINHAANNNLLPTLNAVGQIGATGFGTDFEQANRQQGRLEQITWQIGLQFEVPIGNRGPRAIWHRTLLQRQQAIEQYKGLVQKVEFDVKVAYNEVHASWEALRHARAARFAFEEANRTQEQRQELDANTLERKLARQTDLAEARRTEVSSLARYNIAISALEKAKGTLLRYNNVVMKEVKDLVGRYE